MNALKRLSQVFESSKEILFDNNSRIVLMSDVHRGDGSFADAFSKNENFYFAALTYYYNNDYTYIEIGDGDELWENNKFPNIRNEHSDIFWILSEFYNQHRLYLIFGNHDKEKKFDGFVKKNLYQYFDSRENEHKPLFPGIKVHEGLVLKYRFTGDKIFLIHGHQNEWLNDKMWRLARFLSSYLWKPLELFGVNDPTSTAKNYEKKRSVDKKLTQWVIKEKHMLIAGHTHRPMFPEVGEPPYFNDGSCVHPRCITAIEIVSGSIALVKWSMKTKYDGTLFIGRDVLAGPRLLNDYFFAMRNKVTNLFT